MGYSPYQVASSVAGRIFSPLYDYNILAYYHTSSINFAPVYSLRRFLHPNLRAWKICGTRASLHKLLVALVEVAQWITSQAGKTTE